MNFTPRSYDYFSRIFFQFCSSRKCWLQKIWINKKSDVCPSKWKLSMLVRCCPMNSLWLRFLYKFFHLVSMVEILQRIEKILMSIHIKLVMTWTWAVHELNENLDNHFITIADNLKSWSKVGFPIKSSDYSDYELFLHLWRFFHFLILSNLSLFSTLFNSQFL